MHQVSAPGHTWHHCSSITAPPVMRVFTVTIVDEPQNGAQHLLGTAQHRRTVTYDRCARTVASVPPPVFDIRL